MSQPSNVFDLGRSLCESGWSLFEQGNLAAAERQFRASLAHVPDHPIALLGLGLTRFRQGGTDEAISLLQRAAGRAPNEASIAHALGESLCLMGRAAEAVPHLQRAVDLSPGFAEAHNALGNAFSAEGFHAEAVHAYQVAIELNPALAEARNNLGLAFAALEHHDKAVAHYRAALQIRPDYIEARLNLGLSLLALDKPEEALIAFEAAAPRDGRAVLGRGMALQATGRLDEARQCFAAAVKLQGDDPAAHLALTETKTFVPGDPQIAAMEALLNRAYPPWQQTCLHFALFKAYEDTGRYSDAFAQVEKANRTWRPHVAYDERAELDALARLTEAFTPEVLQHPVDEPSELPIFVVGMPRSGTSLVEQILASHPEVHGAGELAHLGLIATGGYTPDRRSFTGLIGNPDALCAVAKGYLDHVRALAPSAKRIVDKMPANYMFVGLIKLALPKARIVHVRRDPVDTCFSCYARLFKGNLNYTYDLSELGRYYRAYEQVMAHWRAVLPQDAILELDYEKLIGDFDGEARRLVAFCGLDWNERCQAFHEVERPVQTASAFQVRRPLYATSVGRARSYAEFLAPLMNALG